MTEEQAETIVEAERIKADQETAPVLEARATDAATELSARPITEADYRSIGAAIEGDLRNTLKTAWDRLKPRDRHLIQRVAIRAAKVEVASRRTVNPTPKLIRETKQVEAQLASIKAVAAKVGTDAFWVLVERVVDRLIRFAI